MKSRLSWILLAIYLNASAQTLFPFVQDCFAHLFLWKDHLEHVHHGLIHSHHVEDEVSAQSKQNDDQHSTEHTNTQLEKDALSAHLAPEMLPEVACEVNRSTLLYPLWFFSYQNASAEVIFPPPDRA